MLSRILTGREFNTLKFSVKKGESLLSVLNEMNKTNIEKCNGQYCQGCKVRVRDSMTNPWRDV
jgi:ferredoxin